MTEPPPESPHELLVTHRDLIRQVRAAQRGTWFPLVVLGALTLGAIPVRGFSPHHTTCRAIPGQGQACVVSTGFWLPAYWTLGFVLAYAAIAVYYIRRSRSRGVGTLVRPYIFAGIGIAGLVSALGIWVAYHPPVPFDTNIFGLHLAPDPIVGTVWGQLIGPFGAIGLALLVLAWVERNLALGLVTAAYLIIQLKQINFGWHITASPAFLGEPGGSDWFFVPHLVIAGGLLLLAGLGFALIRPARRGSLS